MKTIYSKLGLLLCACLMLFACQDLESDYELEGYNNIPTVNLLNAKSITSTSALLRGGPGFTGKTYSSRDRRFDNLYFVVSTTSDFSDVVGEYQSTCSKPSSYETDYHKATCSNLTVNTTYYYKAVVPYYVDGELIGELKSQVKSFTTLESVKPVLNVMCDTLDFGFETVELSFNIRNNGEEPLRWEIKEVPSWLTCSQTSGVLYSSVSTTVKVTVNRYFIETGNYLAQLLVTSNAGNKEIPVKMFVGEKIYKLSVKGEELNFGAAETSKYFNISNDGNTPFTWELFVKETPEWLSIRPLYGDMLYPNESNKVWVEVNRNNIPPGEYSAEIYISSSEAGDTAISVTMVVEPLDLTEGEYVDLGLPSGTLWASRNVGAKTPLDYGDYFAWGETTTKKEYSWLTYKWCNGTGSSLTKYCTNSRYGKVDNKIYLEASDDAATANWGKEWCMPTYAQQAELRSASYTTWIWSSTTTDEGVTVYGYRVVSKLNGNAIFLPAAGYYNSTRLVSAGSEARNWSSSLLFTSFSSGHNYMANAYSLNFNSSYFDKYIGQHRCYGFTVRPVRYSGQALPGPVIPPVDFPDVYIDEWGNVVNGDIYIKH